MTTTTMTKPKTMSYDDLRQFMFDHSEKLTAPYGVLEGTHKSKKGVIAKSITFGFARTLDATVNYYNRNFLVVDARGPLSPQFERVYHSVESFINDVRKLI